MQPLSLVDVLDLQSLRDDCACELSSDTRLIAFEVGRPVAQSILGTNKHGSQNYETDIYIAETNIFDSAAPLIDSMDDRCRAQSFCPAWNSTGSFLAFVLLEYGVSSEANIPFSANYYVAVWRRCSGAITKVARIAPTSRETGKDNFQWVDESSLLVKKIDNETTLGQNLIAGRAMRSIENIKAARFNQRQTAIVFDSDAQVQSVVQESSNTKLCVFNIEQPNVPLCSIVESDGLSLYDLLISPSGDRFIVPARHSRQRYGAAGLCSSEFRLGRIAADARELSVGIAPYEACLLNGLWSADSGTVWLKIFQRDEAFCCLGKIDANTGVFDIFPGCTFPWSINYDHGHIGELAASGGSVVVAARSDKVIQDLRFDWFRLDPTKGLYVNLTGHLEKVPEFLVRVGFSVLIGVVGGSLIRLDLGADAEVPETVVLGGSEKNNRERATYQIVYPRSYHYNSRVVPGPGPSQKNLPCLIRKTMAGICEYYLTTDGRRFDPIEFPENARVLAASETDTDRRIVALRTHRSGNDVVSLSSEGVCQVAKFNRHVKKRAFAETRFFSIEQEGESSHCEMIFPVGDRVQIDYATVVFIYPTLQFYPHSDVFPHNSSMPPMFNPHVYAAQGYGVLNVGLPLCEERIRSDGIFAEILRILDLSIERASELGFLDEKRLFLQGQSWGAFAATGVLGLCDRFRGCIASAGSYNPLGEFGVFDQFESHVFQNCLPGSCHLVMATMMSPENPWDAAEYYVNSSPFFQVKSIDTPLLIIHGEEDACVDVTQAQQLYTAMCLQKRRVRLLIYGGEGHIISSRHNIVHAWESILTFLSEHDQ